jgi:hypothetical protein
VEWGEPLRMRGDTEVRGMQFSEHGRQLLVCSRRHLILCSVPYSCIHAQPAILELPGTSLLTFACFLQPGMKDEQRDRASRVCVVDGNGMLRIWDVLAGDVVHELTLDLSQGLNEGEHLCKVCQHPQNRNKLVAASHHGQLWVCGFRGDLISVIASTSIAREMAQALHMEFDAERLEVLDMAWVSNSDGGALVVVTPVGQMALHPTVRKSAS